MQENHCKSCNRPVLQLRILEYKLPYSFKLYFYFNEKDFTITMKTNWQGKPLDELFKTFESTDGFYEALYEYHATRPIPPFYFLISYYCRW